ncbi:MAG TPA: TylF/MycF/NovP-related O-methyltransferase [Candidatus Acidoferrales bacterium]|nr:TylF/MycF/NovP-related O-methyltransferase [Candidatus Acidoferrales bacterium]
MPLNASFVRRLHRRLLLGERAPTVLQQVVKRQAARYEMFGCANEYIRFEAIEGDILEFGVFTGLSLALLAHTYQHNATPDLPRRVVGFDSFAGLAKDQEGHARWKPTDGAVNHSWHPLLPVGAPVTPQVTLDLFAACQLPVPQLEVGPYPETLPRAIGTKYAKVALVHIDCDLYEATHDVLTGIEGVLQDGAMMLFDDWFHYRGHPGKGEARAFAEFLQQHPHWQAIHYRTYGTFCNAFILHRR